MTLEKIITFAQDSFGTDSGLPSNHPRSSIPTWLEGRNETAVEIEMADDIEIEGDIGNPDDDHIPSSIDALAYYLPFHFYKTNWGIYVRASGLHWLAKHLSTRRLGVAAVRYAFRILIEHEQMHFASEIAASRLEVVSGVSTYSPYFTHRRASEHEEAISNAAALMIRKWGVSNALFDSVRSWMDSQGPGYDSYFLWLGAAFPYGKREAARNMLGKTARDKLGKLSTWFRDWPGELLFDLSPAGHPPIYLLIDKTVDWLRIVKRFPRAFGLEVLVHTNDHKPKHIHVDFLDGSNPGKNRYRWPSLAPFSDTPRRSNSNLKKLSDYVNTYSKEIQKKIDKVPWN